MKRQHLIIFSFLVEVTLAGFMLWNERPNDPPVLVFKTYESSKTNVAQIAKLEFRNKTKNPIWLYLSGAAGYSLSPQFLERPVIVLPKSTNNVVTNVYHLYAGSFFFVSEKILPGENRVLDFPLAPGKPAEQVGIWYYFGNYKDGNDLFEKLNVMQPILLRDQSPKGKIAFFADKWKRMFRAPKRHEVWCPQPLSYQVGNSTNSTE